MTEPTDGQASLTEVLTHLVKRGMSWLHHEQMSGQLDWALLHGAAGEDLRDIRPTWKQHIHHLRRKHHVVVEERPVGFFRIVGVDRAALKEGVVGALSEDAVCDVVDEDEEEQALEERPGEASSAVQAISQRFTHAARALAALHGVGELANPLLKAAVGMVIRQASECNHWHNSAHFRSVNAAHKLAEATVATPAQYQAFCRRNLRHEHMVPNGVIYDMIVANPEPSAAWIENVFRRYSWRATITREEDRLLRPYDMPPGFWDSTHEEWFEDPFARYKEAGLFDSLVALPATGRWFPVN